jgi:CTP synthase
VMVGKYTGLSDSYLSVLKALQHACIACSRKLVLEWVAATDLEEHAKIEVLKRCQCRLLIVLFKL